jgi:RNA polymerase sigma-54 factor
MEIKMKLGQQLKIKQNQSLIMTPQLQQAIKLLQLTNLELAEFVEKAQLENPFIQDQKEYLEINNTNKGTESPDVYQNMNNTSDPLKKNSELDMQNTFDSHLSSNNNQENKKLYDKEILRTGNNVSAGEVIEKTLENKILS